MGEEMPGSFLTDFAGISEPAARLIDRVSDAVGGIAKPWQIERVAKAEAKADIARASARVQISEMEERALQRMVREEGKKQENIESITAQAAEHVSDSAKPDKVEDDWITNFFDKARLTSEKELQQVWARVLAGQANTPGRYSKRTVEIVASLEKSDAKLFEKLLVSVWMMGTPTYVSSEVGVVEFEDVDLTFVEAKHLDSLGLISFESISPYRTVGLPKKVTAHYYGCPVQLEFSNSEPTNELHVGHSILTASGEQLAYALQGRSSRRAFDRAMKEWIEGGVTVSLLPEFKSKYLQLGA